MPEPELMLDELQARAYACADFEEPHNQFIALLKARFPDLAKSGHALDLGCGPGDISRRFARAFAGWSVDGIDGSPAMLKLGQQAVQKAGLASRIQLVQLQLPADALPRENYGLFFSNSLLHHLADPSVLWSSLAGFGRPGAAIFVMDLLRPASRVQAHQLVEQYAANEPEVLRTDFFNSLLAAYRPDEIQTQLEQASLGHLKVEVVSDRHCIVWGRR